MKTSSVPETTMHAWAIKSRKALMDAKAFLTPRRSTPAVLTFMTAGLGFMGHQPSAQTLDGTANAPTTEGPQVHLLLTERPGWPSRGVPGRDTRTGTGRRPASSWPGTATCLRSC